MTVRVDPSTWVSGQPANMVRECATPWHLVIAWPLHVQLQHSHDGWIVDVATDLLYPGVALRQIEYVVSGEYRHALVLMQKSLRYKSG